MSGAKQAIYHVGGRWGNTRLPSSQTLRQRLYEGNTDSVDEGKIATKTVTRDITCQSFFGLLKVRGSDAVPTSRRCRSAGRSSSSSHQSQGEELKMGRMLEIVTPLHKATKRDYLARMNDDKVHCMLKAKEYEFDYWDGDRRYGYGGYKFIEGRWKPVAQALIDLYGLKNGSNVLDVGCGKAFLLYEMKKILPDLKVAGFDMSKHGLADARDNIKPHLFRYRAQDRYPYGDGAFDLVISLGCLHNLRLFELQTAVQEIERVGKNKYIMVEGYRNELEQFNLECWALTAESILHTSEWIWLYNHFGYTGDYEFIYFE
jgi:SAM-dependent methyltransferase